MTAERKTRTGATRPGTTYACTRPRERTTRPRERTTRAPATPARTPRAERDREPPGARPGVSASGRGGEYTHPRARAGTRDFHGVAHLLKLFDYIYVSRNVPRSLTPVHLNRVPRFILVYLTPKTPCAIIKYGGLYD